MTKLSDNVTEIEKEIQDGDFNLNLKDHILYPVSYTHLRAHETKANLVCRLLLEKKIAVSLSFSSTLDVNFF